MNTPRSVAYGWVALVVAAGGSYYYAKKDLKGRKLDPALRQSRLNESPGGNTNTDPMTWQDRLKELEDRSDASKARIPKRNATRNLDRDVQMESKPTGVDTSTSGPGPQDQR